MIEIAGFEIVWKENSFFSELTSNFCTWLYVPSSDGAYNHLKCFAKKYDLKLIAGPTRIYNIRPCHV